MAVAFEEQQTRAATIDLSFDERFAMLVDREWSRQSEASAPCHYAAARAWAEHPTSTARLEAGNVNISLLR